MQQHDYSVHARLQAGAEPLSLQEDDAEGYTPLSLAARLGRAELLRLK